MASDSKIELKVVVNGKPVALEANVHQPLHSIIGKSLELASVPGDTDKDRWIFADAQGTVLDGNRKIGEFGFAAGATIFLSLKAGGAG